MRGRNHLRRSDRIAYESALAKFARALRCLINRWAYSLLVVLSSERVAIRPSSGHLAKMWVRRASDFQVVKLRGRYRRGKGGEARNGAVRISQHSAPSDGGPIARSAGLTTTSLQHSVQHCLFQGTRCGPSPEAISPLKCERPDSNRDRLPRQLLRLVRLPISPRPPTAVAS